MTTAISRLDAAQWDALVSASPQASPFNWRVFQLALGTQPVHWGIVEAGTVQAGVTVQLDETGTPVGPPDTFGYYQGILIAPHIQSLPEHSRNRRELEIIGQLAEGLAEHYDDIWLGLHPEFRDLRALQWFNYHHPEQGQFYLALRYTGILNLRGYGDMTAYQATLGKGRRGDLKKALKCGIILRNTDDVAILDRLHQQTFAFQNAERGCLERQLTSIATAAIRHGFGELLVAYAPSGAAISATLFVWDSTTGYYLFGASDPGYRDTGATTLVMLESIARAMGRGIRRIDFVGINSPQRGDFKTSFNAAPVPYFDAHWHRPEQCRQPSHPT